MDGRWERWWSGVGVGWMESVLCYNCMGYSVCIVGRVLYLVFGLFIPYFSPSLSSTLHLVCRVCLAGWLFTNPIGDEETIRRFRFHL